MNQGGHAEAISKERVQHDRLCCTLDNVLFNYLLVACQQLVDEDCDVPDGNVSVSIHI